MAVDARYSTTECDNIIICIITSLHNILFCNLTFYDGVQENFTIRLIHTKLRFASFINRIPQYIVYNDGLSFVKDF